MIHHQSVRQYRKSLAIASSTLRRSKLMTMLARAELDAEQHGWSLTAD
jgi:hypothetical protein